MAKPLSAEGYKLQNDYEEVRCTLLDGEHQDRLDKPLAYWALPRDRRLPLVLMGQPIRALLAASFTELTATPGIGTKKVAGLVQILRRAADEVPPAAPFELASNRIAGSPELYLDGTFDARRVTERHWSTWCETIESHGLIGETIGGAARSLRRVPQAIWNQPLESYLPRSLAELRELKVDSNPCAPAVLEVFCDIHQLVGDINLDGHLSVRLTPRLITRLEGWIQLVLRNDAAPSLAELSSAVAEAILMQIDLDVGPDLRQLVRRRLIAALAADGPSQTPRQDAESDVSIDDCRRLFAARWPCSQLWLGRLTRHCQRAADARCAALLQAISDSIRPPLTPD